MKFLLALSAAVLLGMDLSACGGANAGTDSAAHAVSVARVKTTANAPFTSPGAGTAKDSADNDDDANSDDDLPVTNYGRAASTAEMRAISATVERYYVAAAAHDGKKACSMLASIAIEDLVETAREEDQASGHPHPHNTCAAAVSRLFSRCHCQLAAKSATLEVTGVRVETGKALAILRFATTSEPQKIPLHRVGRTWEIWELLDSKMP